ncbi:putative exporter of polyketide antibiotics [Thermocatellispora tengchongensis]|uniref:Putative exporter of polyketide antibiotics n=1 Tax=Thermocatellispora tengchongensis TaxID=1073253 RepID=A0A840PHQ1_9ACTN|nr:hypothetical protein [Thermocatellispora tengchongensis]MBB5137433.1 putative exporter of polyketide antibiotics [Thermocatellispora tengchongensis]
MGGALSGTGPLIRLILRPDRLWLPLWPVLVAAFVSGPVATIGALLPTAESRRAYAEDAAANPAVLLMQGPAYDLSVGGLAAQQRAAATTVFAALAAVLLLIRHTRAEEHAGRGELIGAAPVGRHAPLTAALTVVGAAGALQGALITAALAGAGMPLDGSAAWGMIATGAAWVAAAIAAVAAQLTRTARAAATAALGLFFAMYLVRGVSDLAGPGLSWLGWTVPNGWLLRARPFGDERWWVFAPVLALCAALVAAAYALAARRDLGAGVATERPGPARAPRRLRSPLALAWRRERGAVAGWLAAAAAFGLAMGLGGQSARPVHAMPCRC